MTGSSVLLGIAAQDLRHFPLLGDQTDETPLIGRHGRLTPASGVKIWVITEAVNDEGNRSSTCILLPEEY